MCYGFSDLGEVEVRDGHMLVGLDIVKSSSRLGVSCLDGVSRVMTKDKIQNWG